MSLYLSGLPLWIAATLLVVIPTAIAMCGPVYIRHKVRLERLTTNNEIAGFKFATVGVIYAVLLAFAVIAVWDLFSAGADPDAAATRAALSNYLKLAIEKDWPSMANEQESAEVTKALNALYSATIRQGANGSTQSPVLVAETFKQLDVLTQARRSRLHLAGGIVPGILWTVLFCGAILTVGFTFFFGTENLSAQVMMTGILSTIVFMGLLVIVSINHPFTGPVHIASDPLEKVLNNFGQTG